jgi:hypothetical protein
MLHPTAFPNAATLQQNANLGRLRVTNALGDTDQDGDFDALYAYGSRSFSIWTSDGERVYDSGSDFEQITAADLPAFFNASNNNSTLDDRSDDKGPEPEDVVLGEIDGRTYAFVCLERIGGVMVYDVTDPTDVSFVQYINNRDFTQPVSSPAAKDLAPEGMKFISARNSPIGVPLLVTANEVSGTVTLFSIASTPVSASAAPLDGAQDDSGPRTLEDARTESLAAAVVSSQQRLPLVSERNAPSDRAMVKRATLAARRDAWLTSIDTARSGGYAQPSARAVDHVFRRQLKSATAVSDESIVTELAELRLSRQ